MRADGRGRYDRALSEEQRYGEQRERLIRAVARALRRHGAVALTVGRILEGSGIGRNTFYVHFDGARDAARAAAAAAARRLAGQLERARQLHRTPVEQLRAVMEAWVEASETNPEMIHAVLAWEYIEEDGGRSSALGRVAEVLSAVVAEARRHGTVSRSPDAVRVWAILGAMGAVARRLAAGQISRSAATMTLVDVALRAFR